MLVLTPLLFLLSFFLVPQAPKQSISQLCGPLHSYLASIELKVNFKNDIAVSSEIKKNILVSPTKSSI